MRTRFGDLREQVLSANRSLADRGLAPFTFGNASGIDRGEGAVVIKPSGVKYHAITIEDLVVVDLDGGVIEGVRRPSSDMPTHLVLYRAFPGIGGVAHAHAHYATAFAQAAREIPCLGTTHASQFHGPVPVARMLRESEVSGEYEANTGHAIVERFGSIDPMVMPAVLLPGHAPFSWGATPEAAVETMALLEKVARLAFDTLLLNAAAEPLPDHVRAKHFSRRHGAATFPGHST